MSVRAYRVVHIELDDEATFNLWHDTEVMELLNPYEQLDDDCCGLLSFDQDELEDALTHATADGTKAILARMLAEAKANNGWGRVPLLLITPAVLGTGWRRLPPAPQRNGLQEERERVQSLAYAAEFQAQLVTAGSRAVISSAVDVGDEGCLADDRTKLPAWCNFTPAMEAPPRQALNAFNVRPLTFIKELRPRFSL